MSNAYLSPILNDAQFSDDGTFLAGGLIWFYHAGTSTPLIAYTTPVADTPWTNPIQLDARGETGGEIWLAAGKSYKIILEGPPEYGQTHGVVISTFDNITGVNDPGTTSVANWVAFSGTPTYLSAVTFNVPGDYRTVFLESRRLKSTNTVGLVYSTVVLSTYATGVTTVTVSNDYGQALDAGLSAVSYGFVETGGVSSIPVAVNAGSASGGSQYQMWMNYDGTNLKWSKDADVSSATWPIIADEAVAASGVTFATDTATSGEAQLIAKYTGVNDAYLFNSATRWGIYSTDGGLGVEYTRATGKFAFGGFTLPDPSTSKYVKLPNGLIMQFGQGTASSAGTSVTFATAFPNFCVSVVTNAIVNPAVATSVNTLTTTGFTAFCGSTNPITYIAFGY
jgi:hypothetical protein